MHLPKVWTQTLRHFSLYVGLHPATASSYTKIPSLLPRICLPCGSWFAKRPIRRERATQRMGRLFFLKSTHSWHTGSSKNKRTTNSWFSYQTEHRARTHLFYFRVAEFTLHPLWLTETCQNCYLRKRGKGQNAVFIRKPDVISCTCTTRKQ